jgi:fructose-bisphosphate aldolase class 1
MIILNTIQNVLVKNSTGALCTEETSRILVHALDIIQVYEEHTKRDTHTYAVIRSPTGSADRYRIRETIDDVQRLISPSG